MLLWIALAAMTGLAALALLWPLTRRSDALTPRASDVAIYKDQLAEIDRDLERGLIARSEAQAARIEVSRRLIEADAGDRAEEGRQSSGEAATSRRRLAASIVLVVVPLVSLGVYSTIGAPSNPDQPLAARLQDNIENASVDELVARVEAKLAQNPEDGRGWELMAQIYLRQSRFEDAKQAFANAIRLLGSTADREANFGVATVAAADRMVTADAKAAFERALKLDPKDFRSAYFLGVAKEQDGDKQGAITAWQALMAANPEATEFLQREIARVGGKPEPAPEATGPGPSKEDVAAAQAMTPEARGKMIQGMVSGLSERLKSQGGSPEEWVKLIKAYSVLGQADNARNALADARKALASSPEAVKQMDELSKALGL